MPSAGRILDGDGNVLGCGFPVSTDRAVTAAHVVDHREGEALAFEPYGSPPVPITGVRVDLARDMAAVTLGLDVPVAFELGRARRGATWSLHARPESNSPLLTGVVKAERHTIRPEGGDADIEVVQLKVEELLEGFHGFSGSPVTDDRTGSVIGVLFEVVLSAAPFTEQLASKATNVLYAVPMEDVVRHLGLESVIGPAGRAAEPRELVPTPTPTPHATGGRPATSIHPVLQFEHDSRSRVDKVLFTPDGRFLATAGTDRKLRLWNLAEDDQEAELPYPVGADVVLSGDGRLLATWDGDGAHVYTVPELRDDVWSWDAGGMSDVALSPDGHLVAVARGLGQSALFDLERGSEIRLGAYTVRVVFSPDGSRFASWSTADGVRVWRLADGDLKGVKTVVRPPEGRRVAALAFSRSGSWLLTAVDRDRYGQGEAVSSVLVLDPVRKVQVNELTLPETPFVQVASSADDALLATASDRRVRLWLAADPGEPHTLEDDDEMVQGVGFGPGRSFLAVATRGTVAHVYHLSGDRPPETLQHPEPVRALAVSRDGLVGTASGTAAYVWRPHLAPVEG